MSKKVKERILEVINDELYVPLTPPDLYSLVGEDKYDVADFFDTLCRMEENYEISVTKKGKISSPEKDGLLRGVFSASQRGKFGFVSTTEGEFFIPPKFTLTAMDKDEVLIRRFNVSSKFYGLVMLVIAIVVVELVFNTMTPPPPNEPSSKAWGPAIRTLPSSLHFAKYFKCSFNIFITSFCSGMSSLK